MTVQSFTRKHPIALGIASAAFIIVFVPAAMALQGYPISLLLSGEALPKLVLGGAIFGAVMTGFALVLRHVAEAIEPALAPHKMAIWPVSILAVVLLFYFFGM